MDLKKKTSALVKVAKRGAKTIPVCGNVLLFEGGAVATDLSIRVTVYDTSIVKDGLVPADKVARGLDVIQRNFELVQAEGTADDFPTMDTTVTMHQLNAATVSAIIEAIPTTSDDEVRPILTGVHLDAGHIAATDGYRLMAQGGGHDIENIILPAKVAELLKLSKDLNAWSYGIDRKAGVIEFEHVDGFHIAAKYIEGNFPEWRKLIPETTAHTVTVGVGSILEALSLVENGNIRVSKDGTVRVIDGDHPDRGTDVFTGAKYEAGVKVNNNHLYVIMPLKGTTRTEDHVLINGRYFKDYAAKWTTARIGYNDSMGPVILHA